MFIVLLHYKRPLEEIEQYLAQHRAFLDSGYSNNLLIVSGPQVPRTGGVLLSQATDRDVLVAFLDNDPFILNRLANYELIEFTPVKWHKAFASFLSE